MMIERPDDLSERGFEIEEIGDEAGMRIDRPIKLDLDTIGMAVQPVAAVRHRNVGQPVRRFEGELTIDLGGEGHGIPRYLWV